MNEGFGLRIKPDRIRTNKEDTQEVYNPDDTRFKPAVDALNAAGRTWEWVNDDLLTRAEWTQAGLRIGGMTFQDVVLPDIAAMPLPTAEALAALARAGLPIAVYGQAPVRQPGFLDPIKNDRAVESRMQTVVDQPSSASFADTHQLTQFIEGLPAGPISYAHNPSLRAIRRRLGDGRHLAFVRNTAAQATRFTLAIDPSLHACYWLEATTGHIYAAQV